VRVFVKDIEGIIRIAELDQSKTDDETATVWLLTDSEMVTVPHSAIVSTSKAGK